MGVSESYEQAKAVYASGDYRGALDLFKAMLDDPALKAIPDGPTSIWWNVAVCHVRLGEFEEADAAAQYSGEKPDTYSKLRDVYVELYEAGAADPYNDGVDKMDAGDHAGAILAFEEVLYDPDLDDDLRLRLYKFLARCYLYVGDWGRAEEYAAVMLSADRPGYDTLRKQLMEQSDVESQDLPHYDGSAYDDVFTHAKGRYEAGDFAGALSELDPIVQGTIGAGGFGEEVWLYVALCHLRLGNLGEAETYAGFMTGTWRDHYDEQAAAVAAASGEPAT